jgi:hypothetical protein
MAKKKSVEVEAVPVVKSDATTAIVYKGKQHVRTYSREIHGDTFEELAQQMAAQHEGSHVEVL